MMEDSEIADTFGEDPVGSVWRPNSSVGRSESSVFTDSTFTDSMSWAAWTRPTWTNSSVSDDMKIKAAAVNGPAGAKTMAAALQLVIPELTTLPAASS